MTQTAVAQDGQSRSFNPNEHLMQIKNKNGATDYLPVQWRLVWFREQCPQGTIDTEELIVDLDREVEEEVYVWNNEKRRSEKVVKRARGYARYKATITDGKGGRSTGTKSENAASFPDFIEKAETGAIGRALAGLGFGTQFAPELDEMPRIVDAPVERTGNTAQASNPQPAIKPVEQAKETHAKATSQQIVSINKLCEHLDKASPATSETSYEDAKQLIQKLTAEYRDVRDMERQRQQPMPALPVQDRALVEMIAKAKARCATIQMLWDDVKRDAKIAVVDEALTVQQVAQINGVIAEYSKRMVTAK